MIEGVDFILNHDGKQYQLYSKGQLIQQYINGNLSLSSHKRENNKLSESQLKSKILQDIYSMKQFIISFEVILKLLIQNQLLIQEMIDNCNTNEDVIGSDYLKKIKSSVVDNKNRLVNILKQPHLNLYQFEIIVFCSYQKDDSLIPKILKLIDESNAILQKYESIIKREFIIRKGGSSYAPKYQNRQQVYQFYLILYLIILFYQPNQNYQNQNRNNNNKNNVLLLSSDSDDDDGFQLQAPQKQNQQAPYNSLIQYYSQKIENQNSQVEQDKDSFYQSFYQSVQQPPQSKHQQPAQQPQQYSELQQSQQKQEEQQLVQFKQSMQSSNASLQQSVPQMKQMQPQPKAQQFLQGVQKNEEVMQSLNASLQQSVPQIQQMQPQPKAQQFLQVIQKKEEVDDKTCVICLEQDSIFTLIPCGHKKYCEECAKLLVQQERNCAVCRSPVTSCMRIYG